MKLHSLRSSGLSISVCILALALASPWAAAQNQPISAPPGVEPKADELLRRMSQTLADAKQFTFDSHDMTDQLLADGQKVQFSKTARLAVRRPGAIAAEVRGDNEDLHYCYKDGEMTIVNRREKAYTRQKVPGTIDAMFDELAMKYGLTPPLADLMFADPYAAMTERVRSGRYVGKGDVMGTACHHLAFRQDGIDWQIWLEDSERPVPRKVVITYKELPGYPQFIALLSNWNLDPQLPDSTFQCDVPGDYKRVDLVPVVRDAQQESDR